jgi:hypothetical protein
MTLFDDVNIMVADFAIRVFAPPSEKSRINKLKRRGYYYTKYNLVYLNLFGQTSYTEFFLQIILWNVIEYT